MDLSAFTLPELKRLMKDIDRAIVSFEERQLSAARAELEARARELGFTLAELTAGETARGKNRVRPVAKYRNPNNPEETWSGRGRTPNWLKAALSANDSSLKDFLI